VIAPTTICSSCANDTATAGRAIIESGARSLDDLAVSTIHGFCQRILAESALESRIPFRTSFIEDETEPFQRAARDWARTRLLDNPDDATLIVGAGESIEGWVKQLVGPYRRHQKTKIEFNPESREQTLLADFVETVTAPSSRRRHGVT
jgi:ATP-dependent exoDNAse (exonuclease V) beta subunit